MRHTDIFHVLKSIEIYIWNKICYFCYLPIFIIFNISLNLTIIYEIVVPVFVFVISPKDHAPIFLDALIARNLNRQWQWAKVKMTMRMWFIKGVFKKTQYQINEEVKYILFKYIIMSFSKHKTCKLRTFFGSIFPVHVRNLRIYLVNPCILFIYEEKRIRKKYVNLQTLRCAYMRIQVFQPVFAGCV